MSAPTAISQVDLYVDENEQRGVAACLDDRWLSEGPNARKLKDEIAALTGTPHVHFAPNGTLGLFLALLALDLERGSEIIMPSFTFYGSATAAVFAGLKPVFIDVDPATFNATANQFEAAITENTRALMPVHIYGQCCDMLGIMAVARKHGLKVVEDAAQAFGVTSSGKAAGSFGDIGVFSFFSDKTITMGEGGALIANDTALSDRIALLRNQGRPHAGTFVHSELGMNFRITDMQAAIGLAQVAKLPGIIDGKTHRWQRYYEGLKGVGDLEFMEVMEGSTLIAFRFPIVTADRDRLANALEAEAIQTRGFFHPMHLQPKLKQEPPLSLPVSERLGACGLCLPIHHEIGDTEIDRIVDVIRDHFKG